MAHNETPLTILWRREYGIVESPTISNKNLHFYQLNKSCNVIHTVSVRENDGPLDNFSSFHICVKLTYDETINIATFIDKVAKYIVDEYEFALPTFLKEKGTFAMLWFHGKFSHVFIVTIKTFNSKKYNNFMKRVIAGLNTFKPVVSSIDCIDIEINYALDNEQLPPTSWFECITHKQILDPTAGILISFDGKEIDNRTNIVDKWIEHRHKKRMKDMKK